MLGCGGGKQVKPCTLCDGLGQIYGFHDCPECVGTGEAVLSDGEIYAAHSRSLCTPEQNAAIDAELERIVNQLNNEPAWRSQIAYRDTHVDVLWGNATASANDGMDFEPRSRPLTVAELAGFTIGAMAAMLVFFVVIGKLLVVI